MKYISSKFLITLFLLINVFINTGFAGSSEGNYRVESLSFEEGVSHNMVYAIIQDRQGFMWFGTMFGLIKYDGAKYNTFRHDPFDENTISNDDIVRIVEDSEDNLWLSTYGGGINKYIRSENKFVRYEPDYFGLNNWGGIVWSIAEEGDFIWAATRGAGLIRLHKSNGEYRVFQHNPSIETSISSNVLNKVLVDKKGVVWIAASRGILNLFDPESEEFIKYPAIVNDSEYFIMDIAEDDNGGLITGTNNGLIRFRNKSFEIYDSNTITNPDNIFINIIEKRADGSLMLGTNNGLYLLSGMDGSVVRFGTDTGNTGIISSSNVVAAFEDKTGIIWSGSYLGGINKIYTGQDYFRHYTSTDSQLSGNRVSDFAYDKPGAIFISTEAGITKFDPLKKTFENPYQIKESVSSLTLDQNGNIYYGTLNGLGVVSTGSGKSRMFKAGQGNGSLSANRITVLYTDNDGDVWAGTNYGLNKFISSDNSFKSYLPSNSDITGTYILSIYQDSAGYIWAGTYNGLNRIDKSNDSVELFSHDTNNPNSISNNYVFAMLEDSKGRFWIGTGGGLNLFNREDQSFKFYTERDGLPNAVICAIEEDEQNNLWISTNKGLSKFDPESVTFTNYTVNDGLQSNMFNTGASIRLIDGRILFGGINGFNSFDPQNMAKNDNVPVVALTGLSINGESFQQAEFKNSEEIELPYYKNNFNIEFAALDYINPAANQYAYKLEGYNDEWVYSGNNNKVKFENLPPGYYRLTVKSAGSHSEWSEEQALLNVVITPPFWSTWWFVTVVIVVIAGSLISYHRYRIIKAIRRRIEIEKIRAAENDKVRKKAADDFHDELGHRITKISLYSEILKQSLKKEDSTNLTYLEKITEISNGLSTGVRDFIWTLDPDKDTLYEVAVRLKDFGDELFDKTGIAFQVEGISSDFEQIKLTMDWRRHLTLMFKEAMNNALKYADCSSVSLSFLLDGNSVLLSLKDDGRGLNVDEKSQGRGLNTFRRRADNLNGSIDIISSMEEGTEIRFSGVLV